MYLTTLVFCLKYLSKIFPKLQTRYLIAVSKINDTFASSLVEPIRRALNYQDIGRKLLMVDEMPTGAYARYNNSLQESYTSINTSQVQYTIHIDPSVNYEPFRLETWSYVSNFGLDMDKYHYNYEEEQISLHNYLLRLKEIKEEKFVEEKRREINSAITGLIVEDLS